MVEQDLTWKQIQQRKQIKMTEKPTSLLITAIIVLGIIQIAAFHYGINGTFRTMIGILIAGIVGVVWPSPFQKS